MSDRTDDKTTILGIDPGLGTMGWAVITCAGESSALVASGTVRTSPKLPMSERLLTICNSVKKLIEDCRPHAVAVEDVFLARDVRAAISLGQARGAAMIGIALTNRPVHSYSALEVKMSVTGNGHASKDQVGFMMQRLLNLSEPLTPADCSDAAAIAMCHWTRARHSLPASVDTA